jgi:hypothetical protein
MAFIAVAEPSADEGVSPRETGELPDALDVVGTSVTQAGPMLVRIDGVSGQDAASPAIRTAYFDKVM